MLKFIANGNVNEKYEKEETPIYGARTRIHIFSIETKMEFIGFFFHFCSKTQKHYIVVAKKL